MGDFKPANCIGLTRIRLRSKQRLFWSENTGILRAGFRGFHKNALIAGVSDVIGPCLIES